ncbi:hypothetical protein [Prosthecobacter fluviatilis]|uniref:Uncharacterized protein n=1 Tax=Prosthecobacter fluviatilis TaxID=445931 RepID=A0ABW0KTC9_9BACT
MKQIDLQQASTVVRLSDEFLLALISYECLDTEEDRRRNLFKVDETGMVLWQVGDYVATPSLSTFTNVELRNQEVWAFNFDGGLYRIDQGSGAVLASNFVK